jgi:prepilin-type N-terminal cleavage/methylation domain-containing protein
MRRAVFPETPLRPIVSVSKHLHRHSAFTLTELLVAISIAAMLSAMTLTAMYSATQAANESRSRSIVNKVNELLLQQWADVETRRLAYTVNRNFATRQRLFYTRQLMRIEFPERKSDLLLPLQPTQMTARYKGYLQSLARIYNNAGPFNSHGDIVAAIVAGPNSPWTPQNQHAECLYLILASTRIDDGNALDFFAESEIGDVDGDGMKEILDSWGNPVAFLRWAPGHLEASGIAESTQSGDWVTDPDGFDPLKADYMWNDNDWVIKPYQLYPLVVSAGRDEQYDILFDFDEVSGDSDDAVVYRKEMSDTSGGSASFLSGNNPFVVRCRSNPSRGLPDNDCGIADISEFFDKALMLGMQIGSGADDNISNQQSQVR